MKTNIILGIIVVVVVIVLGVSFTYGEEIDDWIQNDDDHSDAPETGTLVVNVYDTQGGSPQRAVSVRIRNGTDSRLTSTQATGKAIFINCPTKDWDVYLDDVFAGTVEFYEDVLDVYYYLDEIGG